MELSCWIFPEAPEVHSCLCRLEFFTCSLPPALLRALMEGNDGHEWRMRVAGYSILIRSILLLYFTKDIATVYLVDCLTKTCLLLAFWGVGVCVPLPQELCWQ